jgi:hypothetical protein
MIDRRNRWVPLTNMANQTICGHCGAPRHEPHTVCPTCGVRSTGSQHRARPHPLAAATLGLVPGLGHLYLGQWRKGLVLLAAFGAVEILGLDLDLSLIGAAVGIPVELGGFGLWIYSVWDAYRSARRLRKAYRS